MWLPGFIPKLDIRNLFPVQETAFPEATLESLSVAERLLPRAMEKLRQGTPLRIEYKSGKNPFAEKKHVLTESEQRAAHRARIRGRRLYG